ncbi:hypothetical protein F5B21DRAFT_506686 [Xylaria acuta]|nr:hypothetical protein F5B21DRAFT_506686 [Xylaria acuta]
MSLSGIAMPPSSAKIGGLGERAWHRRKLSTPYQPPVSAGLGVGVASGAPIKSIRGNIARGDPPGGPPGSLPLRRLQTPGAKTVGNRSPARPRRSFDRLIFELEPRNDDGRDGGMTGVGMSHPNASTPALGRYGSLSRPNRAGAEFADFGMADA